MSDISRSDFLKQGAIGAAGMMLMPSLVFSQTAPPPGAQQKGPPLDKELVREFVMVAHTDLGKVKAMLEQNPDLLNASHNWSDWDWEDGIGAAGHMGHREMALFLLERGARPTIHVAAMLGQLDIVKAFITEFPAMKMALGPHKLDLVHHAVKGGSSAKPVLDYLTSLNINK